jgi:hypothetical protein
VKINSLSMVAEDHSDSAKNAALIYGVIRKPLVSTNVHSDRKLPLVYVIDSILKNVKGRYIPIIEKDVKEWMPVVYNAISDDKRVKLKKVWNLWRDAGIFSSKESWEEMGECFAGTTSNSIAGGSQTGSGGENVSSDSTLMNAGITFGVRLLLKIQSDPHHILFTFINILELCVEYSVFCFVQHGVLIVVAQFYECSFFFHCHNIFKTLTEGWESIVNAVITECNAEYIG